MVIRSNQEFATNAPPGNKIDEGSCIPPQTPGSQLTGEPFTAGAEVEVRINAEGFYGSWYEATVLSHYRVKRQAKYQVQYLHLVRDEESGEELVEDVRPRAPRRFSSQGPSFSLPNNEDEDPDIKMHDLVEAFHRDGWWHGVVSGLRDPATGLYTVSFPNTREVLQFKSANIRPQSTFANGQWSPVLRIPQKTETYREGDKVDVFRVRDDYGPSFFPARVEKVIHHSYYLVKYESPDAQPNGALSEILGPQHLRPAVNCMPGTNLYMEGSHVEVFCRGGWCPGVVSSGLSGSNYAVIVEYQGERMTDQFHVSKMRLPLVWDGRRWSKWDNPSKAKKRKSVNSNEIFASDVSLTESETTPDLVTSPSKKLKKERKDSLESDDEVPITKPFRVKAEASKSTSQIKRAVRKVSQSRKLLTELKDCHFKISTGKRSITCKRNMNGCAPDFKQDEVDNNGVADSEKQKDVNLSIESSSDVPQPNKNASNTNHTADFAEENAVGVPPHDRTMGHFADSVGQDSLPDGVAKICEGQLVDSQPLNSSATLEHPTEILDSISNPSLSRLISSVDKAAPLPLSENSVSTDPNPNSEFKQHTVAEHAPIKSVAPEIVLPFEMTSSLWKSLETTPVFVRIPQRPHFKMLQSESKETREGTAIGMMVTYANLAESIHRLSIHTEVTIFEEKIACLNSLEMNGFIVDPIQSHLQHLFEMKTNCSKSALKRVELEIELAKEKQENKDSLASVDACDVKLADIRKSIAELKEQLSVMEKQEKAIMEERAGILDLAAEHDHNISRLEDEIFSINMSDELASEEFGRLVLETLY